MEGVLGQSTQESAFSGELTAAPCMRWAKAGLLDRQIDMEKSVPHQRFISVTWSDSNRGQDQGPAAGALRTVLLGWGLSRNPACKGKREPRRHSRRSRGDIGRSPVQPATDRTRTRYS